MTRTRTGLLLATSLVMALPMSARAQVATPSLIGRWGGVADIIVDWTKQRTLAVNLVISANDQVTGSIGDATLAHGRLLRNRSWVARALRVKTDYIIEADLDGPIIAAENVQRDAVQIPFNWRDGRLVGSINSSANKIGKAVPMVFTAKFVLIRMPDLIICETPSGCPPELRETPRN
ncbi:MAG TPA: hypothetical protein VF785_05945 [Gemmatimonadaceae bacterium]